MVFKTYLNGELLDGGTMGYSLEDNKLVADDGTFVEYSIKGGKLRLPDFFMDDTTAVFSRK